MFFNNVNIITLLINIYIVTEKLFNQLRYRTNSFLYRIINLANKEIVLYCQILKLSEGTDSCMEEGIYQ